MSKFNYNTASIKTSDGGSVSVTLDGDEATIRVTKTGLVCYISPTDLKTAHEILIELERINESGAEELSK